MGGKRIPELKLARIRELRAQGLTRPQVAERLGLLVNTIEHIEKKERTCRRGAK